MIFNRSRPFKFTAGKTKNERPAICHIAIADVNIDHVMYNFATLNDLNVATVRFYYGSLVTTSVFGWRTFPDLPDLWLTCEHFVGKVSAVGQPTRPT